MADSQSNSIFGKKVFFLYPSYFFQNTIIENLRHNEYEVYIINDYKNVKNILTLNKECILYVNLDTVFNYASWFNFIDSIEQNEQYSSITIGVISEKLKESQIREISPASKLEAGIITTKDDEKCTQEIIGYLEEHNAKGRRQYVRANCLDDQAAEIFWITASNMMYKMKIVDISSSGIAVLVPAKQLTAIQLNALMPNMNLMLRGKKLTVTMRAQAVKATQNGAVGVLMFPDTTEPDIYDSVRTYIFETLSRKLNDSLFGLPVDQTNYLVKDIKLKKKE